MFEHSGAAKSLNMAVDRIMPGGELGLLGVPDGSLPILVERWPMHGLVAHSIQGRRLVETWERAIAMVAAHKLDLQPLISHVLPLSEGLRGFDLVERGEAVEVLARPDNLTGAWPAGAEAAHRSSYHNAGDNCSASGIEASTLLTGLGRIFLFPGYSARLRPFQLCPSVLLGRDTPPPACAGNGAAGSSRGAATSPQRNR